MVKVVLMWDDRPRLECNTIICPTGFCDGSDSLADSFMYVGKRGHQY